jgi:hypothetical protein
MESAGKVQIGKLFLIRTGNNAIAVRLLEQTNVGVGGAKYEWFCQSDGSMDLSRDNIQVGKGEVFQIETKMYNKEMDMHYTKIEGERNINCGSTSVGWYFGYPDSHFIYFSDKRENDISIVITEWNKPSEIDFNDSRLQWKTMSENVSIETTPEIAPSIPLPNRNWVGSTLAIFLFNSDEISKSVSSAYGQYAEGELLKALSGAIKPDGGWGSLNSSIMGFHGDIVNVSMFGDKTSLTNLRSYLADTATVSTTDLDPGFLAQLNHNVEIGFIPYAVGLEPIQDKQAVRTHLEMKTKNVVGYLGLVYFDLKTVPYWTNISGNLSLSSGMEINGTVCKGWLATFKVIQDVGLRIIRAG